MKANEFYSKWNCLHVHLTGILIGWGLEEENPFHVIRQRITVDALRLVKMLDAHHLCSSVWLAVLEYFKLALFWR